MPAELGLSGNRSSNYLKKSLFVSDVWGFMRLNWKLHCSYFTCLLTNNCHSIQRQLNNLHISPFIHSMPFRFAQQSRLQSKLDYKCDIPHRASPSSLMIPVSTLQPVPLLLGRNKTPNVSSAECPSASWKEHFFCWVSLPFHTWGRLLLLE